MKRVGNLSDFTADMAKWETQTQHELTLLCQGFATTLFNEIQSGGKYSPGTPIRTGFHRAMWDAGVGEIPNNPPPITQAEAEANPGAGRAAVTESAQRAQRSILEFGPGQVLHVVNRGPAIRRLELDGHSQQAPAGFVRLALAQAQQILDEVAAFLVRRRAA